MSQLRLRKTKKKIPRHRCKKPIQQESNTNKTGLRRKARRKTHCVSCGITSPQGQVENMSGWQAKSGNRQQKYQSGGLGCGIHICGQKTARIARPTTVPSNPHGADEAGKTSSNPPYIGRACF